MLVIIQEPIQLTNFSGPQARILSVPIPVCVILIAVLISVLVVICRVPVLRVRSARIPIAVLICPRIFGGKSVFSMREISRILRERSLHFRMLIQERSQVLMVIEIVVIGYE